MTDQIKILYTAEATAEGGRKGRARTSDGRWEVDLDVPAEMGGAGGPGTNPEQLFAVGYAARVCASNRTLPPTENDIEFRNDDIGLRRAVHAQEHQGGSRGHRR